jgi:hypothetical protein
MDLGNANPRWVNYFQAKGSEFVPFWKNLINNGKRDILMIIGLGFDPRTAVGVRSIFEIKGEGVRDCMILDFVRSDKNHKGKYSDLVQTNKEELEKTLKGSNYRFVEVVMQSMDNHNIGGRNVIKLVNEELISKYSDIVIDISAMPRAIFFPLISKIITLVDSKCNGVNLHVVISENPHLDVAIRTEGLADRASFIHGFGSVEKGKYKDLPKVWIPILGEGRLDQLKKIRENIDPHETCPVIPFPSADIRRGDKIITEYKNILFYDLNLEPRNITYVDEQNAFQAYRILLNSINRYQDTFKLFDGCKIILSALSSKLLSIGVLLAAHELKVHKNIVGVLHVDSEDFNFAQSEVVNVNDNILYNLWITGEPYE